MLPVKTKIPRFATANSFPFIWPICFFLLPCDVSGNTSNAQLLCNPRHPFGDFISKVPLYCIFTPSSGFEMLLQTRPTEMSTAADASPKPFNSSTPLIGLQQKKAFQPVSGCFPVSLCHNPEATAANCTLKRSEEETKVTHAVTESPILDMSSAPRLRLLFCPKVLRVLHQTVFFFSIYNLFSDSTAELPGVWRRQEPTCSRRAANISPVGSLAPHIWSDWFALM